MSRPKLPENDLRCPACNGIKFKYVENVEAIRDVIGYTDDDGDELDEDEIDGCSLKVESHYKVNDEVGESDPRLWCCGCSIEYEVPGEVEFL